MTHFFPLWESGSFQFKTILHFIKSTLPPRPSTSSASCMVTATGRLSCGWIFFQPEHSPRPFAGENFYAVIFSLMKFAHLSSIFAPKQPISLAPKPVLCYSMHIYNGWEECIMRHAGTQEIETPRLLLRRLMPSDAPMMYTNWANDPEVTRWLRWRNIFSWIM